MTRDWVKLELDVGTHHPANTAAIEMNRRLGYVDAEWDT
jgi:hypothetical protein